MEAMSDFFAKNGSKDQRLAMFPYKMDTLYFLQSYGLLRTGLLLKWKIDIRKSLERAGIFIIALPELLAGFNSIPKMIQILFTKRSKSSRVITRKVC